MFKIHFSGHNKNWGGTVPECPLPRGYGPGHNTEKKCSNTHEIALCLAAQFFAIQCYVDFAVVT